MVVPEMAVHRSCSLTLTLVTSHPGPCIERARVTYLQTQSSPLDILSQLTKVPLVLFYSFCNCHLCPCPFVKSCKSLFCAIKSQYISLWLTMLLKQMTNDTSLTLIWCSSCSATSLHVSSHHAFCLLSISAYVGPYARVHLMRQGPMSVLCIVYSAVSYFSFLFFRESWLPGSLPCGSSCWAVS